MYGYASRCAALCPLWIALEAAVNGDFGGTALARAAYARDTVLPAMNACRNHADALECLCASHDWPLPSYAELLWLH